MAIIAKISDRGPLAWVLALLTLAPAPGLCSPPDDPPPPTHAAAVGLPLLPVDDPDVPFGDLLSDRSSPRLYVTGLVGSSFATLSDEGKDGYTGGNANATLFTAGGALGLLVERPFGAVRFEVEGRGRDALRDSAPITEIPSAEGSGTWQATDGWSTMANLWRDVPLTDDVAVYLGGGVGAGGYRYSADGFYKLVGIPPDRFFGGPDSVQSFAWQGGGGVTWALSERVVLDVGYRFFALAPVRSDVTLMEGHFWRGTESVRHAFSASELLFGLRVEEPLAFLRR